MYPVAKDGIFDAQRCPFCMLKMVYSVAKDTFFGVKSMLFYIKKLSFLYLKSMLQLSRISGTEHWDDVSEIS